MNRTRISLTIAAATLLIGATSASALEMMTYSYMDKNRDGKVTRQEWTSSANSFKERDWNGDGVLSGDELRVSYKGKKENASFQETLKMRFEEIDVNNDNILSTWEWPSQRRYFDQLDDNGDRTLTRVEFRDRKDETLDAFSTLDKNRNGVLSMKESQLDDSLFNRMDDNRDGNLTRAEYYEGRPAPTANAPATANQATSSQYDFNYLDRNKDGILSRTEWKGTKSEFALIDGDNNNVITLIEYTQVKRSRGANRPVLK